MKKEKITIKCPDGEILKGLLWGNNAAWICKCGELLGDRTGDGDYIVRCDCGRIYEILREYDLGKAKGIIFRSESEAK